MSHPDENTLFARFALELKQNPELTASDLADQSEYLANEGCYTYSQLERIAQRAIDAASFELSREMLVNDDLPVTRKLHWADLNPRTFNV